MFIKNIKKHIVTTEFWRLVLFVLKRGLSAAKITLKRLPIVFIPIVYILHFLRAFLRIFNYFYNTKNKNLGETTKFLFALLKVCLAVIALILFAYNLIIPAALLSAFLGYSVLKLIYSAIVLLFSAYAIASRRGEENIAEKYLKAQYRDNFKKHFLILLMGIAITLLALLCAAGTAGLGLLIAATFLLGLFTLVDAGLAIYYYFNNPKMPEPGPGLLPQKNAWIDFRVNDYYDIKWRAASIKPEDIRSSKVYLLKEIIVKIKQLEDKLEKFSSDKGIVFWQCSLEIEKIKKKIFHLTREAGALLTPYLEANVKLLKEVVDSLEEDYSDLITTDVDNKLLVPRSKVEVYIKQLQNDIQVLENPALSSSICTREENFLWTFLLAYDDPERDKNRPKTFHQSFFKKRADCEDISVACQTLLSLDANTEQRGENLRQNG